MGSWDQIHRDVRQLCHLLIERDFKGIVAITRGGLIPAALIARELNIRLIDTVCIKSYDHMDQGGLDIMKGVITTVTAGCWLMTSSIREKRHAPYAKCSQKRTLSRFTLSQRVALWWINT